MTYAAVEAAVSSALAAGSRLAAAAIAERAAWLMRGLRALEADEGLRDALSAQGHLSRPMIDWALATSLESFSEAGLSALAEGLPAPRPGAQWVPAGRLCVVVLSANVFTAPLRALVLPLLFGLPVLAKASPREDLLPRRLAEHLANQGQAFHGALACTTFPREDTAASAALLSHADVLSVYGGDATVAELRGQLRPNAAFVGHGHGLGCALLGRAALTSEEQAAQTAQALASDVAAYDQLGCLSPHFAFVESGAAVTPQRLAELLHTALERLAVERPRARLSLEAASSQLSWRGIGAMRGELLEGTSSAVCLESEEPLRSSPGYRNVLLVAVPDVHAVLPRLAGYGAHLKCVGVAGLDEKALLAGLPREVAPRVCEVGRMQRPEVDAIADGKAAWEGFVRWRG